jgi:hypothetical protein
MFTNELNIEDLNYLVEKGEPHIEHPEPWEEKKHTWRWPHLKDTLLVNHYLKKSKEMYTSPHEGVVYTEKGCKKIVEFLNMYTYIRDELFHFNNAMEEFAFQTISMNSGENFYYIGDGCCTEGKIGKNDPENGIFKFMYKIKRQ